MRLKLSFTVLVLSPRSTVMPPLPWTDATLNENAPGGPTYGCPRRLKRMRSIASASVTVPTVDRGFAPIRSWSTLIAVVSPSRTSTSGRASVGMKPCTKALYVSLMSRWDSAAIVPKTSELLPEPETPVNTVSRRLGISRLTSLRLFTRAPCTRIRSWRWARGAAGEWASDVVVVLIAGVSRRRSAQVLDADDVARGIAEGAVADAVRLVGRLLHDLGVARPQAREGPVDVTRGQVDAGVGALGHHLRDGPALVVGDPGGGRRGVQDDGGAGLVGGADRDPVHSGVL